MLSSCIILRACKTLCGICLQPIGSLVWCKRTPDMTKQVVRSARERLKVRSGISQERLKVFAMMIMRDDAA